MFLHSYILTRRHSSRVPVLSPDAGWKKEPGLIGLSDSANATRHQGSWHDALRTSGARQLDVIRSGISMTRRRSNYKPKKPRCRR